MRFFCTYRTSQRRNPEEQVDVDQHLSVQKMNTAKIAGLLEAESGEETPLMKNQKASGDGQCQSLADLRGTQGVSRMDAHFAPPHRRKIHNSSSSDPHFVILYPTVAEVDKELQESLYFKNPA